MVKTLEQAIAEVTNLPADQEQIGRKLLSHVESDYARAASRLWPLGIVVYRLRAQRGPMDHRGVPFTIRTGIEHNRWTMVVHLPQGRTVEKAVHGARHMAETAACNVIDKWLEKNLPQGR